MQRGPGHCVSAQAMEMLTLELDAAVQKFHQAWLKDEWLYLVLDEAACACGGWWTASG